MRTPVVNGYFYPAEKKELLYAIRNSFLHKLGCGKLPKKEGSVKNRLIKAIISPHAGYTFSGPCMSHVFYEIANSKTPDTYLMIGLSHEGFNTCLSNQDFETPLGIFKNNIELTNTISKSCSIPINNPHHANEHSIEVLLPFLQFVKQGKDIKIVPLIIGIEDFASIRKTGLMLKKVLEHYDKDITIIVSSDFTHYGPNYGYIPEGSIEEMDTKAIELIKKANAEALYNYHEKTGITICGIYPIAILLETISFKKADLLCYYKSTEIVHGNNKNNIIRTPNTDSVSYAAIIFR
jgi:MEMO1 family protein